MLIYKIGSITIFSFLLLVTGCVSQPTEPSSTYQELGSTEGITRIVDEFLFIMADDKKFIHHFDDSDIDRFREKLIEQICFLSDGPCEYTGDSMKITHEKMIITEGQFNSLVDDLIDAMENTGTPITAQNKLLKLLALLHDEIMQE